MNGAQSIVELKCCYGVRGCINPLKGHEHPLCLICREMNPAHVQRYCSEKCKNQHCPCHSDPTDLQKGHIPDESCESCGKKHFLHECDVGKQLKYWNEKQSAGFVELKTANVKVARANSNEADANLKFQESCSIVDATKLLMELDSCRSASASANEAVERVKEYLKYVSEQIKDLEDLIKAIDAVHEVATPDKNAAAP